MVHGLQSRSQLFRASLLIAVSLGLILGCSACGKGDNGAPTPDVKETVEAGQQATLPARPSPTIVQAADANFKKGVDYLDQGRYELAVDSLSSAIELNSNTAGYYYNRGLAYYYLGEHPKAIDDLTKAIKLAPDASDAYILRGVGYERLSMYSKALNDYTKAIELAPNEAMAYYNRGVTFGRDFGDYHKAVDDLTRSIELAPNEAGAYYNRALAYQGLGESSKANEDFAKARELDPSLFD